MDWHKLDDYADDTAGGPAPSMRLCKDCSIEMETGPDLLVCPLCHQERPYDRESALQPVAGLSVVRTRTGELCNFARVEYDRRAVLIKAYDQYCRAAEKQGIMFPPAVIERAVDVLQIVQSASTANRGRNLSELMGGALFVAICEFNFAISETTMARIFNTKGGLSRGKNGVLSLLIKEHALAGTAPRDYLRKDPKKLMSQFIRGRMSKLGLNIYVRRLYLFLKALVFIEDLYGYIDTQTLIAKLAGALYFYYTWLDRSRCDNRIIPAPCEIDGSPVAVSVFIATRLEISEETLRKYYNKIMHAVPAIQKIGTLLSVAVR